MVASVMRILLSRLNIVGALSAVVFALRGVFFDGSGSR